MSSMMKLCNFVRFIEFFHLDLMLLEKHQKIFFVIRETSENLLEDTLKNDVWQSHLVWRSSLFDLLLQLSHGGVISNNNTAIFKMKQENSGGFPEVE